MRGRVGRTLAGIAAAALAVGGVVAVSMPNAHTDEPIEALPCGSAAVTKELANGAAWRMCARIHPVKGLVLEQVEFRPATGAREYPGFLPVIDELYLSQLNVPYDNGLSQFNDITSYGFGNQYLVPQTADTCLGDTIDVTQAFAYLNRFVERTVPGICVDETPTGLASHSVEDQLAETTHRFAEQGTALQVSSISKISWYEYQELVTFGDHGEIDVALGATGDLAPSMAGDEYFGTDPEQGWPLGGEQVNGQPTYATSHWHSAIWRVDFGIGGSERQFAERWDYATTDQGLTAPVTRGAASRISAPFSATSPPDRRSWWRIGSDQSLNPDGLARSYEIVNQSAANVSIPVTEPILTVTENQSCAEYASHNLNPACPNQGILEWAASEAELTDPVAWINVGYHHIDRNEDQSPMPIHWQRFQLVPRDFFAQNPAAPPARSCINGPTGRGADSAARPCIATNVFRPSITAGSTPVVSGTTLTAKPGLWNQTRTTWNYAYMWFRDGAPILDDDHQPALGTSYTVSAADLGSELTVKVTASQTGFPSGTAESRPLAIPKPAGPDPTEGPTSEPTSGPTTPPAKATATLTVRKPGRITRAAARKGTTTVLVRVTASGQTPQGVVRLTKGAKVRSGWLSKGQLRIRLPKIRKVGKHRVHVQYLGSGATKPASMWLTVRVVK
ncbi:hypothetical protein ACLM5J_17325 [Nocardioides sp. Bht2]|uniref:copper amine oxidase n=1 Tax=Nocardioides sp. Bht2 TaxID=3392297 RepID=UPI0039B487B4